MSLFHNVDPSSQYLDFIRSVFAKRPLSSNLLFVHGNGNNGKTSLFEIGFADPNKFSLRLNLFESIRLSFKGQVATLLIPIPFSETVNIVLPVTFY